MGCFAFTCGISGLPIRAGDPVRFLLLTETAFKGETAPWFPRTFPLRARYNDYGSVEKVPQDLGMKLWQEGLRRDLVPVGRGENPCHNVPTSKDMDWEALLEALWEDRVRVLSYPEVSVTVFPHTVPKGVPTMKRVRRALAKAGLYVVQQWLEEGYYVDKVRYGTIRVRWNGNGPNWMKDSEFLTTAQVALRDYATVIVAGSGRGAQLMVHVKPDTPGFCESRGDRKTPLHVRALMIREDVWAGLLDIDVYSNNSLSDRKKAVRTFYTACLELLKGPFSPETLELLGFQPAASHVSGVHCLTKDPLGAPFGWASHWKLLVEEKLPLKEVSPFLDDIAEALHVYDVIAQTQEWRPSVSCNTQFGEAAIHEKLHTLYTNIAHQMVAEEG